MTPSLLLWHPQGRLLAQNAGTWPTLELAPSDSPTEKLRETAQIEAWLLHDGGLMAGRQEPLHLQALTENLPTGWAWAAAEASPLPRAQMWQRPGWRARILEWLSEQGIHTPELRLISSTDLNTVVEVKTGGRLLFLKVSASPLEAAFSAYLSRRQPELLPPLLAAGGGWQLSETGGELLEGSADLQAWEQALRRLAAFQTSADAGTLAELGAERLPFAAVWARVTTLLEADDVLRGWGLTPEKVGQLQAARPVLERQFERWQALGLPDLPAHGDAHPRNALVGQRGAVWFDWSETKAAAHPLLDAGWFLFFALHPAREELKIRQAYPDLGERLSAAYAEALGCPSAAAVLTENASIALTLMCRAAIYDETFRTWEGTVVGWRPNYVGYYLGQVAQILNV